MRLFHKLVLCCLLTLSCALKAFDEPKTERPVQSNLAKIALCMLATVYKHPFMTAWSIYATVAPWQITYRDSEGRTVTNSTRGLFTYIIDALLLGDFSHNLLHAYHIKHTPCFDETFVCEHQRSCEECEKSSSRNVNLNDA